MLRLSAVYVGKLLLKSGAQISAWNQSYDPELQRQRCKNLQRHEQTSAFWKQNYFLLL
jgi:hypothetical protein